MPEIVPLDAAAYTRIPNLDTAQTVALAIRLLAELPARVDKAYEPEMKRVRAAARALRRATVELQDAWRARDRQAPTKLRPFDLAADNAWSACLARLESWAQFAEDEDFRQDAAAASELQALLFPGRLDFIRLSLPAQWAESEKRMQHLATGAARQTLARLIGEPFVARLERTHAQFGDVLGMRSAAPQPSEADVAGALRATQRAMSSYALQVVATHDATDHQELAAILARMVRPVDQARAPRPRNEPAAPDPVVTPDTPLPPVPADA